MVAEAERFKQQDEGVRKVIGAKNGLERYIHNVKNSINEEKSKTKLSNELAILLKVKSRKSLDELKAAKMILLNSLKPSKRK